MCAGRTPSLWWCASPALLCARCRQDRPRRWRLLWRCVGSERRRGRTEPRTLAGPERTFHRRRGRALVVENGSGVGPVRRPRSDPGRPGRRPRPRRARASQRNGILLGLAEQGRGQNGGSGPLRRAAGDGQAPATPHRTCLPARAGGCRADPARQRAFRPGGQRARSRRMVRPGALAAGSGAAAAPRGAAGLPHQQPAVGAVRPRRRGGRRGAPHARSAGCLPGALAGRRGGVPPLSRGLGAVAPQLRFRRRGPARDLRPCGGRAARARGRLVSSPQPLSAAPRRRSRRGAPQRVSGMPTRCTGREAEWSSTPLTGTGCGCSAAAVSSSRRCTISAPADSPDHPFYEIVSAEWATRWPAEELWVACRTNPAPVAGVQTMGR